MIIQTKTSISYSWEYSHDADNDLILLIVQFDPSVLLRLYVINSPGIAEEKANVKTTT